MKKRVIAVLLTLTMLAGCFVTACGNGNGVVSDGTETEITADGEGSTEAESTSDENGTEDSVTALSLMQEYNGGALNVTDDNYRTYYEVFVYSFFDSDGDGIGDLKGLTEKLDYINDGDDATDTDLGCNGIWLMPIMPSTTYHKYDVTDYCAIDEEYGTMEDFENFMSECHKRGINVIIDLVMNHTSSKHEWFTEAEKYLQGLGEGAEPDETECPFAGYYNFSKESKSGYFKVPNTDWYYEAQFWSEMPDLNLGNEQVRAEFESIVDFWLDLGVDGFRLDAAKEYYSNSADANIEVLTWFHDMVKEKKEDAYIVAEVWTDITTYSRYYSSGVSCFDFAFADSEGIIAKALKHAGEYNATVYGNKIVAMQEALSSYQEDYIDAPFYSNHDMGRSAGYYAGDYSESQTKMGQAMNLLMSGSAFLYYGEELGMKGSGKDENKRAPMYWSSDASVEGMCNGPKDMDSFKMKYGSLEVQETDGNSIYNFVKETIKLRNQYPVISHGVAAMEKEASNENVCVLKKTYQGEEMVLLYNISENTETVDLSAFQLNGQSAESARIGGVLLTGTEPINLDGSNLTLPPYSVVILK